VQNLVNIVEAVLLQQQAVGVPVGSVSQAISSIVAALPPVPTHGPFDLGAFVQTIVQNLSPLAQVNPAAGVFLELSSLAFAANRPAGWPLREGQGVRPRAPDADLVFDLIGRSSPWRGALNGLLAGVLREPA
jgi:hypothetical protein